MEALKDIFVPYEIAQKLKEIGFDEPCMTYYYNEKLIIDLQENEDSNVYLLTDAEFSNFNKHSDCCSVPTYEQVVNWFNKQCLYGNITPMFSENKDVAVEYAFNWFKCIGKYDDGTEFDFATYQQAREQLIYKLIEIYKDGK